MKSVIDLSFKFTTLRVTQIFEAEYFCSDDPDLKIFITQAKLAILRVEQELEERSKHRLGEEEESAWSKNKAYCCRCNLTKRDCKCNQVIPNI